MRKLAHGSIVIKWMGFDLGFLADSLEKTLMLGNIEGRRRRGQQRMRWLDGITDQLDGHDFEQALGVGDGQGSLVCCSPWGRKESDTTERLNWKLLLWQGEGVGGIGRWDWLFRGNERWSKDLEDWHIKQLINHEPLTHSFIQQILIEYLFCAGHTLRGAGNSEVGKS